jgi:hypothetical protein
VDEPPIRDIFDLARAKPDRVYWDGGNWMWTGQGDVARIICPRCWNGGGGTLRPIRIEGADDVFYLCNECEGLWPIEQFDWDNYTVGLLQFDDDYDAVVDV